MTSPISLVISLLFISVQHVTIAQDDFIRMLMLSSLLNQGGSGGGGGGGGTGQSMITGFEGDPRSGLLSSSGGNAGLFGGLMGLLSRGGGGGMPLAPLLLDVDGDLLRQTQLWQRGVLGGSAGSGVNGNSGGSAPSSVTSMLGREAGPMGSPLSHNPSSGTGISSSGRAKSMPHIALPFDVEFSGSSPGQPAALEGNGGALAESQPAPSTTGQGSAHAASP